MHLEVKKREEATVEKVEIDLTKEEETQKEKEKRKDIEGVQVTRRGRK